MNKPEVKGNCSEQKGKLKKIEILTDNDLMFEGGKKRRDVWQASDKQW